MSNRAITSGEIDALLVRVGAELFRLAGSLKSLQSALGPVLAKAGPIDPCLVSELQGVDATEQTLEGLGKLLSSLGLHLPAIDDCKLDTILDELKLADLTSRLRYAHAAVPVQSGDMELF